MDEIAHPVAPVHAEYGTTPFEQDEEETIEFLLRRHLHKDEVSKRQGPGGTKLTYLEINRAIELANWIFSFKGWSSSIQDITMDFGEDKNGRFSCGISAIVRVTLQNGCYHEDVGYGTSQMPDRGSALEKAKKEAVSDALKRCLRLFGNGLGNCLSDKEFIAQLSKGLNRSEKLDLESDRPKKRMKSDSQGNQQSPQPPWPQPSGNGTHVKQDPSLQSPPKSTPWSNNPTNQQPNGSSAENPSIRPSINGALNQSAQPAKKDFPLPTPMQPSNANFQAPPPPSSMMNNLSNNSMSNAMRPALAPVRPGVSPTPPNTAAPLGYTPSNSYSQTVGNIAQNSSSPAANRFQSRPTNPLVPGMSQLPGVPSWQQQQPPNQNVKQEANGAPYQNGNQNGNGYPSAYQPPIKSNAPANPFAGPVKTFPGVPVQQTQHGSMPFQPTNQSINQISSMPFQPTNQSINQSTSPYQAQATGRTYLTPPSPVPQSTAVNGTSPSMRPGSQHGAQPLNQSLNQSSNQTSNQSVLQFPENEPFPELPPTHPEPNVSTLDLPSRFDSDFNDAMALPDGR